MWDGWVLHGHIHNNDTDTYPFLAYDAQRVNVGCELLDYRPLKLNTLTSLLDEAPPGTHLRDVEAARERFKWHYFVICIFMKGAICVVSLNLIYYDLLVPLANLTTDMNFRLIVGLLIFVPSIILFATSVYIVRRSKDADRLYEQKRQIKTGSRKHHIALKCHLMGRYLSRQYT